MNPIGNDTPRACFAMFAVGPLALVLSGCGGDSSSDAAAPPAGPTLAQRSAAATTTAQSGSNACTSVRPFYWEIGSSTAALVSGSVTSSTDPTVYTAMSSMSIASASKWVYSTYVVQKNAGVLSASDIKFLTFSSGYTNLLTCPQDGTVQECVDYQSNGVYTPANDGKFAYNGGHMQKHAALAGLGPLDNAALATEIQARIGSDVAIQYGQPQLADGIATNADNYARFLRKILRGELRMHDSLGTHAVCTNPATCPTAVVTPSPPGERWHYSVGHWVEDDPIVGDGSFSSPGAFGFYPWIDAGKTTYGIVARADLLGAIDSVHCGRLIRKAWMTATPQ